MTVIKFLLGLLCFFYGIYTFWQERKSRHEESSFSYLVQKSVTFQGYLLAIVLILIGFGLMISPFLSE